MINVRTAAIDYLKKHEFSVIPVKADKSSYIKWRDYQKKAPTETDIIEWWGTWPDAGVGIITGNISRLYVIDVDSDEGYEEIKQLLPENLEFPIVRTPGGGWHYYFRYNGSLPNNVKIINGADFRGEGGYVVAPPSIGQNGKKYEWEVGLDVTDIPDLPESYISAIHNSSGSRPNFKRGADLFREGQRDNSLFSTARSLFLAGKSREEVSEIIIRLASASDPPFPKEDALKKVESALVYIKRKNPSALVDLRAETIQEIAMKNIPKIERLVEPLVERRGYTLIGAMKGVGKSLFVTQLGLHFASGKPFLISEDFKIAKPGRVLMVQQEVSESGMQDRIQKMLSEDHFDAGERFLQKTTTGNWWHLTKSEDYRKLAALVERYEPDILILDPLYTFYPGELNTNKDVSEMINVLFGLKENYNLGLVVVHHFSNKEDPDSQRSPVGRFMGHSMIANAADVTVGLDFLHPRYRNNTLPLPYSNYATVEITTRHTEWPANFAMERQRGRLLFSESHIWETLGRSLPPGRIEEIVRASDGEVLQTEVIRILAPDASSSSVKRAINEALNSGRIIKETVTGRGNPRVLKLAS